MRRVGKQHVALFGLSLVLHGQQEHALDLTERPKYLTDVLFRDFQRNGSHEQIRILEFILRGGFLPAQLFASLVRVHLDRAFRVFWQRQHLRVQNRFLSGIARRKIDECRWPGSVLSEAHIFDRTIGGEEVGEASLVADRARDVGDVDRAVFALLGEGHVQLVLFVVLLDSVAVHFGLGFLGLLLVFHLDPAEELGRGDLVDLGGDHVSEEGEFVVELAGVPGRREVLDEQVPGAHLMVEMVLVPGETVLLAAEVDVLVFLEHALRLLDVVEDDRRRDLGVRGAVRRNSDALDLR